MIDFVNETFATIEARMIAAWEVLTNQTLIPASPERVMLAWFTYGLSQAYEKINFAANQNLLSESTGEYLDALAQIYGDFPRPEAKAAIAFMVFSVSNAAVSDITIPRGTLVSDESGNVVFATNYESKIPAGQTSSPSIVATCTQVGTVGNGYAAGQINRFYGGFAGAESCTNTSVTQQGRDVMSDEDYRAYLKYQLSSFSVAGSRRAYEYIAKSANERISDVCVVTPDAGEVCIYAVIDGNNPENGYPSAATSGIKAQILAACSADTVRPLTDSVSVGDPGDVTYAIEYTYYIRSDATQSAEEVQALVTAAQNAYERWQAEKLGRDINPSKLTQMLMDTGVVARVEITSPTYTQLNDGSDGNAPDLARCTSRSSTNGGVVDA